MDKIPCPFVYANGKKCPGHVVRVEVYKADVEWSPDANGRWRISRLEPRSHYHLFCSKRDNHAGMQRSDDERMKFYRNELPEALREVI